MSTKVKGDKIKESSIPLSALKEMPHAYPVQYMDTEYKVVELGGEKLYLYLGEISIPAAIPDTSIGEIEGTLDGDIVPTQYIYQPIYEGILQPYFESRDINHYLNLYIGNDKCGYTSLAIEPSEDPNNLKWFDAYGLGMFQDSPGGISFAWSNYTLHYKAMSGADFNINIKVYSLFKEQQLDVNLIPNTVVKTTPQTLSDTDKNQALTNLGITDAYKAFAKPIVPIILPYSNLSKTWSEVGFTEEMLFNIFRYKLLNINLIGESIAITIDKWSSNMKLNYEEIYVEENSLITLVFYKVDEFGAGQDDFKVLINLENKTYMTDEME